MTKPDWMRERERVRRSMKRCITCDAGGDLCGRTKVSKVPMYRCRRHPSVVFWDETLACEDYNSRS